MNVKLMSVAISVSLGFYMILIALSAVFVIKGNTEDAIVKAQTALIAVGVIGIWAIYIRLCLKDLLLPGYAIKSPNNK